MIKPMKEYLQCVYCGQVYKEGHQPTYYDENGNMMEQNGIILDKCDCCGNEQIMNEVDYDEIPEVYRNTIVEDSKDKILKMQLLYDLYEGD